MTFEDDKNQALKTRLVDEVTELGKETELPKHHAFGFWCANNILNIPYDEIEKAAEIGPKGNELGIDIFYIDYSNKVIWIAQVKWNDTLTRDAELDDIQNLTATPGRLMNPDTKGNQDFMRAKNQFSEALNEDEYTIRLVYVTTGNISENVRTEIENVKQKLSNSIIFQDYGLEGILNKLRHPKTKNVTINMKPGTVMELNGEDKTSLFAIVNAKELVDICGLAGEEIFSLNPRLFLKTKKNVNKSMYKTLTNDQEKMNFLMYNNGITATCDTYNLAENRDKVVIENMKIVNGCQTILTLKESTDKKKLESDVEILLKLYQVNYELASKISSNTNNQNAIKDRDLASNHPLQIEIEAKFKGDYPEFFWERKEGERNMLGPSDIRRYKPAQLRIINNRDAARNVISFTLQMPAKSINEGDSKIFDIDSSLYKEIFSDTSQRDFFLSWVIMRGIAIFSKSLNSIDEPSDDQKNMKELLSVRIGRFYVLAYIAKELEELEEEKRSKVKSTIEKFMKKDILINVNKPKTEKDRLNFLMLLIQQVSLSVSSALGSTKFNEQSLSEIDDNRQIINALREDTTYNLIQRSIEHSLKNIPGLIIKPIVGTFDKIINAENQITQVT